MIFGEERKTLIPQMKRMVGAGSVSPMGKENSTEIQSRFLGSHVRHAQTPKTFLMLKIPDLQPVGFR